MIIDAINFGGEIDMLLGRLNHHKDYVDTFVIAECDKTYTGLYKGYLFEQHESKFKQFLPRIYYHKIKHLGESHAWTNEYHQRQHMNGFLKQLNLQDEDIVFYFDTDEWINFETLNLPSEPTAFNMKKFLFSVHWYQKNELTGFGSKYEFIKNSDINTMRWARNGYISIENGWHWTSLGSLEYHLQKLRSFSHTELLVDNWVERATNCWKNGIDFLTGEYYAELELDQNYPKWILEKHAPKNWYRKRP